MQLQEVIDRTPWIPSWHETGSSIDRRHCLWIYELLVRLKPQRTLEIGSYHGCSSSAFIAANIPDAHFADITVSQRMREVIGDKGTIHQRKGCDVLRDSEPFDVVLLDGAHDMGSVLEELNAMFAKELPSVIIAHDVHSSRHGFPHCEGAAHVLYALHNMGWVGAVDAETRDGEMTQRGLVIAARNSESLDVIEEAQRAAGCS